MTRHPSLTLGRPLLAALTLALLAHPALAGFGVSPIRVDLDRQSGTGAVTVTNDGAEPISVQLRAALWAQDGEGRDVYTPAEDLIFFPKIVTVPARDSRVIRVGVKVPATVRERSYRLYVEQIPSPRKGEKGARVAIVMRFGVPVFVHPPEERLAGEVSQAGVAAGGFAALVRNTGNAHFRIEKLRLRGADAAGEEIFSKDIDGWYLLAGAERRYEAPIPGDVCPRLARVSLTVSAEETSFESVVPVEPGQCSR